MTNDTTRAMPAVEEIQLMADKLRNDFAIDRLRFANTLDAIADHMRKSEPTCWSLRHKDGVGALFADCMYESEHDAIADAKDLNGDGGNLVPVPLYTTPLADAEDARRSKDPIITLVGVDEYGPKLEWSRPWSDFPVGTTFK